MTDKSEPKLNGQYACPICHTGSYTLQGIKDHIKAHQLGDDVGFEFQCPNCEYQIVWAYSESINMLVQCMTAIIRHCTDEHTSNGFFVKVAGNPLIPR